MTNIFKKVNSVIIPNYKDYWVCPLINKYLPGSMQKYEGTLILLKNKKNVFISHPFNYQQAKKEYSKIKNTTILTYNTGKDYKEILNKYCKGKSVGYYGKYITVGTLGCIKKYLKEKKFIDVSKSIDENRIIKEKSEIRNIKKAVKITNEVLDLAIKKLKVGVSEKEIEKFINNKFDEEGVKTAFCIVAFSKNSTNLHHSPSNTKLKKNSAVLFDVGCNYNGYNSDISRSLFFGDKKSKEYFEYSAHKKIVEEAIKKIEEEMKSDIKASKLMEIIHWEIPHALGHGLGLDVHDVPSGIGKKSNWKLKNGMVLAIEPGWYGKKYGIRIENNYLIIKNSCNKL
jgi:Xaa-Pro aminopeptidase